MKFLALFFCIIVSLQVCIQPTQAQNQQKLEFYVESGHSDWIDDISYAPDGKSFVTASRNGVIKVWDVKTKKELKTLVGRNFVFSPIKDLLIVVADKKIQILNYKTSKVVNTIEVDNTTFLDKTPISISPNGKELAIVKSTKINKISLINLENGKEVKSFEEKYYIQALAFSPDGNILASGGESRKINLWDVDNSKKLQEMSVGSRIYSIAFSPDGKLLATGSGIDFGEIHGEAEIWDIKSQKRIASYKEFYREVTWVKFTTDGNKLFGVSFDGYAVLWDIKTGTKTTFGNKNFGEVGDGWLFTGAVSPNEKTLIVGGDSKIFIWDLTTYRKIQTITSRITDYWNRIFSADGRKIAENSKNDEIKLWNTLNQQILRTIKTKNLVSILFSPDSKLLAYNTFDKIVIVDTSNGQEVKAFNGKGYSIKAFSPDSKVIAIIRSYPYEISLVNLETGRILTIPNAYETVLDKIIFSPDGKSIASTGADKTIKIWDVESGKLVKTIPVNRDLTPVMLAYSPDGKSLAYASGYNSITVWDIESNLIKSKIKCCGITSYLSLTFSKDGDMIGIGIGHPNIEDWRRTIDLKLWKITPPEEVNSYQINDFGNLKTILKIMPNYFLDNEIGITNLGRRILIKSGENGKINLYELSSKNLVATLIALDGNDWIISTPQGRFDTSISIEKIESLHWVTNDEYLKPLPLEIFSRQYYEPNLLLRLLKCTEENNCDKEFKPLPSIAEINRVQPNVKIKEIKPAANSADLADVTIEVENVTDEVSLSATDKTQKKQLFSGVFDLRLFRDGQLVGVASPKDKLAQFIADAPRLVAENKELKKLIDTPEDVAWREANDIFKIKAENVKQVSPTKIEYTFRNIKLPRDGRKEVEFTAYAFNSDKVKSTTTEPFKFTIPQSAQTAPKKGRAFVVSIGVNASENSNYALRYAANDARKMQEVVGGRLKQNLDKYSEVVQIPLISDYSADGNLSENSAQKAIIKGVFSLLSGNGKEVPESILRQIPNREKIKPIEPEDTLLITYSGHGYTDQSGIFYILPYDIGKETTQLTPEVLQKTISSDELSLWMQDITAAEMIMIIDACHSSAAVQGDGFKPGPMGSRGLGQLAYDKDMKILSATQANNVALELGSLQQGLLSYALIQDGIVESKADADKNKQLFSNEWLSYAEKRVPELYQEVKDGKRGVIIDGKNTKGAEIVVSNPKQKSNLNLQQPTVFDFKRRKTNNVLLNLP